MINELEDQVEAYFVALADRIAPGLDEPGTSRPGDGRDELGERRPHPMPLAGSGPRRSRRRLVAALAVAAIVVLVVVTAGLVRGGSDRPDRQDVITNPDGPLPLLIPTFLPAHWVVSEVYPLPVDPSSTTEFFMTEPELEIHALWTDDPSTTPSSDSRVVQVATLLLGEPLAGTKSEPTVEESPGQSVLNWDEGGLHVAFMGRNIPADQLLALRNHVTVTEGTVSVTRPEGFRDAIEDPSSVTFPFRSSLGLSAHTEGLADATSTGYLASFRRSLPSGGFEGDWGVTVVRARPDRLWLAHTANFGDAITPTEVDGQPGFSATTMCDPDDLGCTTNPGTFSLFWWTGPDAVVVVQADTEANARAIAASLTEVDATAFDDFRWNVQHPPTPAPDDQPANVPSNEAPSGQSAFETTMLDSTGLPRVDSCGQVVRFTGAEMEAARQAASDPPQEPVIGSSTESSEFTDKVFAILRARFEAETGCIP